MSASAFASDVQLGLPADEQCWRPFRGPTNVFCVTLYNEGPAAFEATIGSLLLAVGRFHRQWSRESAFSVICVIADGRDQMDPRVAGWLRSAGLTATAAMRLAGAEVHLSLRRTGELQRSLGLDQGLEDESGSRRTGFVVVVKDRNQGKLQSHDLFFATLCRELQPTYCFQIDCGTALEPDALGKLVARMEAAADVAALALRILPAVPRADDGLFVWWQYLDFALQKSVGWPFEIACGYLSVVPGQASLYRWNALEGGDSAGQGLSEGAPLQAYLKGAETSDPLARLMFLAEDRVIGSHIVLGGSREWQLDYAPEAGATTDSCSTLPELLRQRRRWRNSALACLAALFRQWRGYLARHKLTGRRGLRFSVALAGQLGLALKGFFAPAQLIGLAAVLFASVESAVKTPQGELGRNVVFLALAWQLILLPVGGCAKRRQGVLGRVRRVALLLTSGLLLGGLLLLLPLSAVALLLLAPTAALVSLRLTLPAGGIAAIADIPLLPFVHLAMESVLSAYSFWNFNDVSWGTKGLRRTHEDPQVSGRLKRWRNRLFFTWAATNSALAVAAFSVKGFLTSSLNPVTEVMCIADGVIAVLGLLCVLSRRWWRRYD